LIVSVFLRVRLRLAITNQLTQAFYIAKLKVRKILTIATPAFAGTIGGVLDRALPGASLRFTEIAFGG
jgi:hypothetical protein